LKAFRLKTELIKIKDVNQKLFSLSVVFDVKVKLHLDRA